MSQAREHLHYYLRGTLHWHMSSLRTTLRHTIHLIEVAGAEDLASFKAGLQQLLTGLEKLSAALPARIKQTEVTKSA